MGCFALGIPLLWKATLHLPSPDQGFDIRLSDAWVKERFLSALAGEYTNIPNFKCSEKTLLLIRCVEWSLFSQKAQDVRGFGFLFPGWSGGVEWKHYCVWNRGSKSVGVGGKGRERGADMRITHRYLALARAGAVVSTLQTFPRLGPMRWVLLASLFYRWGNR